MNGRSWVRWLDSFSDNRQSKTCPEPGRRIQNRKWAGLFAIVVALTVCGARAEAQQPKVYRVGVITSGGQWFDTIDGLRDGLRQIKFEEGKHFNLVVRDTKGDLKSSEEAAKYLEQEKVDLIYTTSSGVTIPAKRVTAGIPIVFCVGADPVSLGLVESFAKPAGRLTGVFNRTTDLTAKRLEILKEIVPKIRRVVTFYNPGNPVAIQAATAAREAARQMGLELVERHGSTVEELQNEMRSLKVGDVDAFFAVSDVMVNFQPEVIIDAARSKRLPTMLDNERSVIKGGLASYAVSFHEVGRVSAKYVQRILTGVKPKDLPVEGVDKISLVINLKTAKQIGLTIPQSVLYRADKVIR